MQILVAAVLAAAALAATVFGGISIGENAVSEKIHAERAALSGAEPELITRPDTADYVFTILCDTDSSDYFVADEGNDAALSERAERRNAHLVEETGAYISRVVVPSVYDAAWTNALSGMNEYSLYAASAADELSLLLSAGMLRDVSQSRYIRTEEPWFDGSVMESLSLYGGEYLISSTIADARQNTAVLVYNRALHERAREETGRESLTAVALNGALTLERVLVESRAAETEPEPVAEAEVMDLDLAEEEKFHGFGFGREDIFPLYVAAGGRFAEGDIVSLSVLRESLAALAPLFSDASAVENPDGFAEGATLFTVATLSEAAAYREAGVDVGILPLPKQRIEDTYRAYVDPRGATMLAIPKDVEEPEKAEYLVYRMAFLSAGYIEPYFYEGAAGEDPEEQKVLEMIFAHTVCDLSGLLGYGDIETLIAEAVLEDSDRLVMDYYNRKTLYEKALSILEKRLKDE